MAAMASRKASLGVRPPPPPIAQSSSPIEIYDTIEPYEPSPQPSRARNKQNRRSVPPVPLADDNDYIQPNDDSAEEYEQAVEIGHGRPNHRRVPDQYYPGMPEQRQPNEYYVTTGPNRNSYYAVGYENNQQNYHPPRYGISPPPGSFPQDIYDDPPFDDEYIDPNYHHPQGVRKPVDRRQSRKNMGRAIVDGLNTARVKEVRLRLRPAFGPDELIDSVERRSHAAAGSAEDDIDQIDVSSLSVAERMKLLEAKAAKKPPPPPTYPKPRPISLGTPSGPSIGGVTSLKEDRSIIPPNRSEPKLTINSPYSPSTSSDPSSRRTSLISLEESPWYFGNCDQHKCEEKLKSLNKEGAFLIRASKKGEARMQPYTLCLFHEGSIYNLMVRLKPNSKYAVGSEKAGEPEFNNLADMVKMHADIPIEIIPKNKSRKPTGGLVWLTMSPLK